ncbi:MAG: hypothetical protein ACXIUZ_02035 [Lysobacteraceae bacterium]
MTTPAQLTAQVSQLLDKWRERERQLRAWVAGDANGGPNGDGRYPLTDPVGNTELVKCPARLQFEVDDPTGKAVLAQTVAAFEAERAVIARTAAEAAQGAAQVHAGEALSDRGLAQQAATEAVSAATVAVAQRQQAQSAALAAEDAAERAEQVADVLANGFRHIQSSPSATWNILHQLGKYPVVAVVDSTGAPVEGRVQYATNRRIYIHFSAPFTGEAYLS